VDLRESPRCDEALGSAAANGADGAATTMSRQDEPFFPNL
jgi:hypothetical protein